MLNAPLSVYYLTKVESMMWSSLSKQEEAVSWQEPGWIDRDDRKTYDFLDDPRTLSYLLNPFNDPRKQAQPNDMDANPYRRYCKIHKLKLGTTIERVSHIKYNSAVFLTCAIQSLKHLAGTIEAVVRFPLSLGFFTLSFTASALGLNRICPTRIKVFFQNLKEQIQSPQQNLAYLIREFVKCVFYTFGLPVCCYQQWNRFNIRGLDTHFSREVRGMEGDMTLSEIYQHINA